MINRDEKSLSVDLVNNAYRPVEIRLPISESVRENLEIISEAFGLENNTETVRLALKMTVKQLQGSPQPRKE